MSIEINQKITRVNIKKKDDVVNATPEETIMTPLDIDPLTLRIEQRPEGSLNAVTEKILMVGAEGKKKVYVVVSFMPVDGIVDGRQVTITRPIEFFIPSGQLNSEHQWITATMRNLSLAARGGYVTQALQDLRKVAWDKGLVRCGWNRFGKPAFHDSEVAAIAWSIQQILLKKGFLDDDGNQVPLDGLISAYNQSHYPQILPTVIEGENTAPNEPSSATFEEKTIGTCPECRSGLQLMDGCPTCVEGCGWSKCG